jgi:acetyltransferase-like isoleucine patch superfamily enzyme
MSKLFGSTHYDEHDPAHEGFRHLGRNIRIARNCTIVGAENISLGDNVRIDGFCSLIAGGAGELKIGDYVHVGGYCSLLASDGLFIDDFSTLSWGCKVFTRSDAYSGNAMTNPTVPGEFTNVKCGPVRLQKHCAVGAGAVLLPDIELEEGCAVGALSLVTKSLPAWNIYSGVPARRVAARSRALLDLEARLRDR